MHESNASWQIYWERSNWLGSDRSARRLPFIVTITLPFPFTFTITLPFPFTFTLPLPYHSYSPLPLVVVHQGLSRQHNIGVWDLFARGYFIPGRRSQRRVGARAPAFRVAGPRQGSGFDG